MKNQAHFKKWFLAGLAPWLLALHFHCNPFELISVSLCLCASVPRSIDANFLLYTPQITFMFWHGVLTCACLLSFSLLLDDGPSHTLYQPSETVPITAGTSITGNQWLLDAVRANELMQLARSLSIKCRLSSVQQVWWSWQHSGWEHWVPAQRRGKEATFHWCKYVQHLPWTFNRKHITDRNWIKYWTVDVLRQLL